MKILFYVLPILAGVAMTIQAGVNSQLRIVLNNPLLAAFISFITGTAALGLLLLFSKKTIPSLSVYAATDWYNLTGGLLGAFFVMVVILTVRQIGTANLFALIIAGQFLTALVFDHYGLLGFKINPVTVQKLIGILLLISGAYLVNRK
ncbi:MAG TPA: DMT family transporter [Flavitalea sp.]|nr:DMT family transporter [Flavitalea sp.]